MKTSGNKLMKEYGFTRQDIWVLTTCTKTIDLKNVSDDDLKLLERLKGLKGITIQKKGHIIGLNSIFRKEWPKGMKITNEMIDKKFNII